MSTPILHITKLELWHRAKQEGTYHAGTLASHGFIHCSTPDQVLLCIDPERVQAEVRYENLDGGQDLFPHIYGPLNVDAVVSALDFSPQEDGTFVLPAALRPRGDTPKL